MLPDAICVLFSRHLQLSMDVALRSWSVCELQTPGGTAIQICSTPEPCTQSSFRLYAVSGIGSGGSPLLGL